MVVGFTRARPWCPCALGVVTFIRGSWVHSRVLCESLDLSSVLEFTPMFPGGRFVLWRAHSGSSGSVGVVEFTSM